MTQSVHGIESPPNPERFSGSRVEAFSGMATELYELLAAGRGEEYRHRAYERRGTWPTEVTVPERGPVSFGDDGTVMALRMLPPRANTSPAPHQQTD